MLNVLVEAVGMVGAEALFGVGMTVHTAERSDPILYIYYKMHLTQSVVPELWMPVSLGVECSIAVYGQWQPAV